MTKIRVLRLMTASLATLAIVAGVFGAIRYGAICAPDLGIISVTDPVVGPVLLSLGIWRLPVTVTCPLGFLERSLAARELLPQWPSVLLVVFSVLLLGRVFCGWICPTVLLRRVFGYQGASACKREAPPKGAEGPKGGNWGSYSSYAVLGSVLLASYLFRFPVFCFFCPIGIFFGFLYAVVRAFTPDSLSVELVLFPAMLFAELWLLKSWCRSICPVGALLSIVGSLNRFLLPTLKKAQCLTSKGVNCRVCTQACPEGIPLEKVGSGLAANSCTKCLECYEKCPKGAIEIAVMR
jgi:polyferredoxin